MTKAQARRIARKIVPVIAAEFNSLGTGGSSDGNPIAAALAERPPMFALGVDIEQVVTRVIQLMAEQRTS
jgi:hypothetical protein